MKCPFCAEQIQDEAILCRFCGATKDEEGWHAPVHPVQPVAMKSRPNYTILTAAVFFFASAAWEATALTSSIPLFGALRGGLVAAVYHILYIALYLIMGAGLWKERTWAFRAVVGSTVFYTLDNVRYLFEHAARQADLAQQLDGWGELAGGGLDTGMILSLVDLMILLFIACWWGFVLYLYWVLPPEKGGRAKT